MSRVEVRQSSQTRANACVPAWTLVRRKRYFCVLQTSMKHLQWQRHCLSWAHVSRQVEGTAIEAPADFLRNADNALQHHQAKQGAHELAGGRQ